MGRTTRWTLSRRGALRLGGAAMGGLVLPASLTGCGDSGDTKADAHGATGSGGKVSLTFWDTNAGPDRTPKWKHLIEKFESENPNISVEYVGIPEAHYQEKMQTAIAGGEVPDVANPGVNQIAPFIAQQGLLPLDSYFESWKSKSDISEESMTSMRAVAADEKLYAIPFSALVNVLYYRKDLIKKAGLPDPGSSWDNFYSDADALTKPDQGMYGFGLRGGAGSVRQLESWLFAASGIDTFFDDQDHATLNRPEMATAMERFVGMYGKVTSKSDLDNAYRDMVAEFDGGHAAMIFHNLGSYPDHIKALGKEKLGVTVLPPAPNGKLTIEQMIYSGYVILRDSKHPDEAWKLVSYLSSAEAQSYYNKSIGQIPSSQKAAGEPWLKKNAAAVAAEKALSGDSSVFVTAPTYLPSYSTAWTEMEPALQQVLLGKLSCQDFLNQWADKLNTALSQYRKAH